MDRHLGSHKLATYLHPGPSGPFLEFNNAPMKPPSPTTTALLQHNPSLIDLCTFNSFYHQLAENSSASNITPCKSFVNSSDFYFYIPPMTQIDCSDHGTNESNSKSSNMISDSAASPISSAGECSPNVSSYASTPYSSPKLSNARQHNSPLDLCVTKGTTSTITVRDHYDNENTPKCELSGRNVKLSCTSISFEFNFIKNVVSQVKKSSMDATNDQYSEKKSNKPTNKQSHASPILHRLLTSPRKSTEMTSSSIQSDSTDNEKDKTSPQYRPRYSSHTSESKSRKTSTKKNKSNK